MADLDVTYIMDFLIENHVVDNQILEVINSMVSFDEMLYLPDMPNLSLIATLMFCSLFI